MNKTNNMLTAETVTTAQIKALRTEAATAGDMELVATCTRALDAKPTTAQTDARETCADVINAARAMETV